MIPQTATGEMDVDRSLTVGRDDDGSTPITSRVTRALALLAPFAVSVVLTTTLYGASLSYGFMLDDSIDLPRATDRSYLSIFTDAGQSSYYRPLVLAIWKTAHVLLGHNDGVLLHLLVLATHALNGWLVYRVGVRLHSQVGGYLAAVLFLAFTLSYQAIGNNNAFFHPLVTAFLLAGVLLYWRWREQGSPIWLGLAACAAVLAVFTHEYGVVVAIFIILAEAFLWASQSKLRLSPAPALFVAITLSFAMFWFSVPKWEHRWSFDPVSTSLNAAYFLQGIVYPISGQLSYWPPFLESRDASVVLLFASPVLALALALHLLAHRALSFGFAAIWTSVALLPALATLPFTYVIDGPRLFYLSSVGIALLWAGALAAPFRWRSWRFRVLTGAPLLGLALLVVVQSARFIEARNLLFAGGAQMVRELVATASDPQRPGRTYVNLPSWLALKETDYLLGHTGVTMIPDYTDVDSVVYIYTGKRPGITSLAFDEAAQPWDYFYAPHGSKATIDDLEKAFRRGGGVYAARFDAGTLGLEYVGAVSAQDATTKSSLPLADFGGWARLLTAEMTVERRAVGLILRWQSLARVEQDFTMFVHVYGANGDLVAQADGYPIGAMFPPRRWRAGDLVEDRRRILLPHDLAPGKYRVAVGIYDRASARRVPALDYSGERFPDDAPSIGDVFIK